MNHIITIDGPAGSGKSTISRILAKKIGYSYLDTGAMYRAVALVAKRNGVDFDDGKGLGILCNSLNLRFDKDGDPPRLLLGKEDISSLIRSPEMDMLSSKVSAVGEVREAMTGLQRKIAKGEGYVAEGRDMGTVVFPEAAWKFYLTASSDVRAGRRYEELLERGEKALKNIVKTNLKKRDHQDRMRPLAPLKPAEDALIIDSTTLTIEEVVEVMLSYLKQS
ncbi:MAG: (d)CMP kinase [Deltaproteobacteria bacterium]|jgi:cytidylate kinase|nr:(d)CMP kinase [Deltaproteobacteria bacterium]